MDSMKKPLMVADPCTICLELFDLDSLAKTATKLECTETVTHIFHRECLDRWIASQAGSGEPSCPLCRKKINLISDVKINKTPASLSNFPLFLPPRIEPFEIDRLADDSTVLPTFGGGIQENLSSFGPLTHGIWDDAVSDLLRPRRFTSIEQHIFLNSVIPLDYYLRNISSNNNAGINQPSGIELTHPLLGTDPELGMDSRPSLHINIHSQSDFSHFDFFSRNNSNISNVNPEPNLMDEIKLLASNGEVNFTLNEPLIRLQQIVDDTTINEKLRKVRKRVFP